MWGNFDSQQVLLDQAPGGEPRREPDSLQKGRKIKSQAGHARIFFNYDFIKHNPKFIKFPRIYDSVMYDEGRAGHRLPDQTKLHHINEFPSRDFKVLIPKTPPKSTLFSPMKTKKVEIEEFVSDKREKEIENNVQSTKIIQTDNKRDLQESIVVDRKPIKPPKKDLHPQFANLETSLKKAIDIFEKDESDFTVVKKNEKMFVGKVVEEGNPVVLICLRQLLDFDYQMVHQTLFDFEQRCQWDKVILKSQVLKRYDDCTDLTYSTGPKIMMVSQRDFLTVRRIYTDHQGYDSIIFTRSVEDPIMPPVKKLVRVDCQMGAWLITKLGPSRTQLGVVMQLDIKGLVPKSIVNMVAPKQTIRWCKDLESELQRQQKRLDRAG